MSEYHKIPNVFKRDEQTNKIMDGVWTSPELEFTQNCVWEATEKVDGTNVRVIYPNEQGGITVRGKTDRATLHPHLIEAVHRSFNLDVLREKCASATVDEPIIFYGEGYGAGIQKVGVAYRADKAFVLFDVRVGFWWLRRGDVNGLAGALGCEVVPWVKRGPLSALIDFVSTKPSSSVALANGRAGVPMEGVVCRPYGCELLSRNGERLIAKIKAVDFS